MTSFGKWTPTVMIRPKNHIRSSDYVDAVAFVPPYMKEPEDMQMIMSHSYAKKWNQEKTQFKQKLLEIQNENAVYLMRRYVVRGLGRKMRNLELAKRVPSRVKVGKKVPFAVRLRPPEDISSKSQEKSTAASKPTSLAKLPSSPSRQSKKVEIGGITEEVTNFEELNRKLEEFAETDTHLHAEQIGRKFKIYRVKCPKNHYHGCDCEADQSST
ncbi:hypothetical protein GE061_016015 [Apolygus lucorum]|uniref:Uncharacterized protein n=1 Tax=Apolygus lucorum TaxID=248454 RepID=A0A8S9XH27_APOLU|nr:hypothetical protein GE061_016015 [Apolygus lucorum]